MPGAVETVAPGPGDAGDGGLGAADGITCGPDAKETAEGLAGIPGRGIAVGSTSGEPHSLQNCALPSDGARQRGQNRGVVAAPGAANSTTRAGAMAVAAEAARSGSSDTRPEEAAVAAVALRSTVPVGPRSDVRGTATAAGGGVAGAIGVAVVMRYPHATQKRTFG